MPPPIGPIRDIISPPAATLNQGKEIIIHCRASGRQFGQFTYFPE